MARSSLASNLAHFRGTTPEAEIATLIIFNFDTPVYTTSTPFPVVKTLGSHGSQTYISNNGVIGISGIMDSATFGPSPVTISISGVDTSYISQVVSADYRNKTVEVYLWLYKYTAGAPADIVSPFKVWEGTITNTAIQEGDQSSVIQWETDSHWARWDKRSGRFCRYKDGDTDKGFEFCSTQNIIGIEWGGEIIDVSGMSPNRVTHPAQNRSLSSGLIVD